MDGREKGRVGRLAGGLAGRAIGPEDQLVKRWAGRRAKYERAQAG